MPQKTLQDLFVEQLRDILYAEKQLVKALPKMAKLAQSPDLKAAFEQHLQVTQTQVDRLKDIFGQLELTPRAKTCDAMDGLLEEADGIGEEFANSPALDAALIAAGQKVEHYEMATYGCLRTWAEELGMEEAAALLQQTLDEEQEADLTLTKLATSRINREAEETTGAEAGQGQ